MFVKNKSLRYGDGQLFVIKLQYVVVRARTASEAHTEVINEMMNKPSYFITDVYPHQNRNKRSLIMRVLLGNGH